MKKRIIKLNNDAEGGKEGMQMFVLWYEFENLDYIW